MTSNWDSTLIAQRKLYRQLGVRERRDVKRCGRCGFKSIVRDKANICFVCKLRDKK